MMNRERESGMSQVRLDIRISQKCNEAIVISGSSRSGTTIFGKILHSFEYVEYAYEPPMLFSLFALMQHLDEDHWKLLYETYLYEEFLMNALAGRSLNCNQADDSSIYNVKPVRLIEERLNKSLRKVDAELLAQKAHIVYKIPDVVPFLPHLKKYYPGINVIVLVRKAPYVFYSILEKGWFNDRSLREENLIWPNRYLNGVRIPFWVDPNDDEWWVEMDELHRVAYYYVRVNQAVKDIPGSIIVKYRDLVEKPETTVRLVADRLSLRWGDKTGQILSTVSDRRKDVDGSSIIQQLKPDLRGQVEYYSSIS